MIKKESIKNLLIEVIHEGLKSELELQGFKYAKSKGQFSKAFGKFKQIISISHYGASIEFYEPNENFQLHFRISTLIEIPKFEKWCKKEYGKNHRFGHRVDNLKCFYNLSEQELGLLETFHPTKSRKFKEKVSRAIAGESIKEEITSFEEIKTSGFEKILNKLNLNCNAKTLYENELNRNNLSFIRMLEFMGEQELAKRENIQNLNLWKTRIEEAEFKSVSDRNLALVNYNKRINLINQRFATNLKPWIENSKPFEAVASSKNKVLGKIVNLSKLLTVTSPSNKVLKYYSRDKQLFQFREDGSIIKFNLKGEINSKIQIKDFDKVYLLSVNKCQNEEIFYVANTVLKNNNITQLEYSTKIKNYYLKKSIPYSQVFLEKKNQFAFLVSNNKKHELHFCDTAGNHIRKIELPTRPVEIIPKLEIVLCGNIGKSWDAYSFNGDLKHSMISNNAYNESKKYYDYNLKADLFLSGRYYTKSQLFNLSTGKLIKNLWAHPTRIKGYKEKLYSDINHNFGMGRFKFSPDGDYIIGGADHGKYVAWSTSNYTRYELIPNEAYLLQMERAEIVEIEGHKMLKNRANHMGEILFFKGGEYFGFQIKKDLLIWNTKFEHIDTIFNLGYIKCINENLLLVKNGEQDEIYEVGISLQ